MRKTTRLVEIRTARASEQGGRCFYCGFPMWSANGLGARGLQKGKWIPANLQCTAEHLLPRSDGGQDGRENVVAACRFCNQTRHRRGKVLPPNQYREHVQGRVRSGKWHSAAVRRFVE
ncbi:hypothetical protein EET67_24170 [Pseudaminobacter arsenicus]|uniref:HNH domain-containing protein n=2 Tax=Borborobacter arsenicus TaxID=1851146 RepID=A0A432UZA1_9HYPH|nr:hypothetical protein EET67_24170 [Pseudaminobacter arsenicus]